MPVCGFEFSIKISNVVLSEGVRTVKYDLLAAHTESEKEKQQVRGRRETYRVTSPNTLLHYFQARPDQHGGGVTAG